jgi:hypothetical protein
LLDAVYLLKYKTGLGSTRPGFFIWFSIDVESSGLCHFPQTSRCSVFTPIPAILYHLEEGDSKDGSQTC